jgi:hypothetical protein
MKGKKIERAISAYCENISDSVVTCIPFPPVDLSNRPFVGIRFLVGY